MEIQQNHHILQPYDLQKIQKGAFQRLLLNNVEQEIVENVYFRTLDRKSKYLIYQNVKNQVMYPMLKMTLNQKEKIWLQTQSEYEGENNDKVSLQKLYYKEESSVKFLFINLDNINFIYKNENYKHNFKQMLLIVKEEDKYLNKSIFIKNIMRNLIESMILCLHNRLFYKFSSNSILVKNDGHQFNIKVVVPYFIVQKNIEQSQSMENSYYQEAYQSYLIKRIKKLVNEIKLAFKKKNIDSIQKITSLLYKTIQNSKDLVHFQQKLAEEQEGSVMYYIEKVINEYSEQDLNRTEDQLSGFFSNI